MYALNETVFLCIKKQLLFTSLHGRLFSFMTHYTWNEYKELDSMSYNVLPWKSNIKEQYTH